MVAVFTLVLLAAAALAVDAAMGFAARAEAQRIADSAALAGGSAFLEFEPALAEPVARDRAYEYALLHTIRGAAVDSSEVTVQVLPDERKIRVGINKRGLPTWFARSFGVDAIDVGAVAAAQATEASAARCLKPFAIPDIWEDADDDEDWDNVWDDGEEWDFNPDDGDWYTHYDGTNAASASGYGSEHRGDLPQDWGRQMILKTSDPQSEYSLSPGLFFPWRLPPDPEQEECAQGGGGGQPSGGATYRNNICSCNTNSISLGTPYDLQPGNMIGPTFQGIDELIAQDPNAVWETGGVNSPTYGTGLASPRVVKVALFDPTQVTGSGMQSIEFNNFALMFLEGQENPNAPVIGRFMYYVSGEGSNNATTGSLVLYLRLVE
jgi:hypothetical protein